VGQKREVRVSYVLKRATSGGDFDKIKSLHRGLFEGPDMPSFHGAWWLMKNEGKAVAFCGVQPSRYFKSTAYLCRVGVDWGHQGKRLQRRLIRIREMWARLLEMNWVVTDTEADNYASINSLIRCGYTMWKPPVGTRWASYHSNPLYWKKYVG
jgi:GNAT superfamily N-acetyltransferase